VDVLVEGARSRRSRLDAFPALRRIALVAGDRRAAIEAVASEVFRSFLSSRFDKVESASVLAVLGDVEAGRFLLERARKGKAERPMAIELCGELRLPGASELLEAIASDKRDPFRGAALRGLGSLEAASCLRTCAGVLRDEAEDADLRCDAAEGLLLLGTPEAEGELRLAEQNAKDQRVRRISSVCLFLFGKPPAELRLYLPLSGEEIVS
jgi:hypothetical protein